MRLRVCVRVNRKWQLYLKLGAEAHSRAKQARSTAAYTSRKKMVTMLAMVLSFPEKRTSWRKTGKAGGLTLAKHMGKGPSYHHKRGTGGGCVWPLAGST